MPPDDHPSLAALPAELRPQVDADAVAQLDDSAAQWTEHRDSVQGVKYFRNRTTGDVHEQLPVEVLPSNVRWLRASSARGSWSSS